MKKVLNQGLRRLVHAEQPKCYLLALFNDEYLTNKVILFNTPKEAKEHIKEHNLEAWTAYLIDMKHDDERPYIKLS